MTKEVIKEKKGVKWIKESGSGSLDLIEIETKETVIPTEVVIVTEIEEVSTEEGQTHETAIGKEKVEEIGTETETEIE